MSNNHTKSKKILTATAAVAATLGATAVATTNAHADTISDAPAATQSQAPAQSQSQTDAQAKAQLIEQQQQTRDAYNQAHSNAEQAQGVANSAQANYNQASDAVANNQSAAQANASDAAVATSAQASDQTALNQANQALKQAADAKNQAQAQNPGLDQSAIDRANQAVNDANKAVSDATSKLSNDQATATKANQDAATAKSSLDNVNGQLTNAQQAQKQAQDAVNTAQKALDNRNDPAAAIKTAQDGVNQAQGNVNDAQRALDQAVANVNAKQTGVNNAQSAVNQAQEQLNNLLNSQSTGNYDVNRDYAVTGANKIVLSNDMVSVLKDFVNGKINDQQLAKDPRFVNGAKAFRDQYNNYATNGYNYISNNTDRNKTVSWDSAMNDASTYLLALLNPIRVQLGLTPLTTNTNVQNLAKEYGKATANNSYMSSSWYSQNHVAQDNGFTVDHGFGNNDITANYILEGFYYTTNEAQMRRAGLQYPVKNVANGTMNIDNLHHYLHNYIIDAFMPILSADASGHLSSNLSNISIMKLMLNIGQLAGDDGQNPTGHDKLHAGIYISPDDTMYYIFTRDTTPSSAQPSAQKIAQARQTLSQAQTNLSQAKTALAQAQQAQSQAQTRLDQAKAQLTQAQQTLAQAKSGQTDYATLQRNLANAKAALAKATGALSAVQPKVMQAQTAYHNANVIAAKAQQAVERDQKALDNAKSAVTKAQNNLKNLTAGHEALIKAIDAYNDAVKKQEAAQEAVKADQAKIAELKAAGDKLKAELPELQAKLDAAKKALDDANVKLEVAREAESKARANIITDARIYGEDVKISPVPPFHAGTSVPKPEVANATGTEAEPMIVAFAESDDTATINGESVPAGTTADWANKAQVASDARQAGTYYEDVLVTFPDGSTTTINSVEMQVLPALTNDRDYVPAELPSGARIDGNVVVDANGQILSNYEVIDGQVMVLGKKQTANNVNGGVAGQGNRTANVYTQINTNAENITNVNNDKSSTNNELPQTGNSEHTLGLVGLGLAAASLMFGFAGNDRKRV